MDSFSFTAVSRKLMSIWRSYRLNPMLQLILPHILPYITHMFNFIFFFYPSAWTILKTVSVHNRYQIIGDHQVERSMRNNVGANRLPGEFQSGFRTAHHNYQYH